MVNNNETIFIVAMMENQNGYARAVSDLKNTKLNPANNIKWNGKSPKSFKGTALYIPKRK